MKKPGLVLFLALFVYAAPAPTSNPGVVFEVETTDHSASPPRVEETQVAVEEKNIKMGIASGQRGSQGEMIYRGDRREMIVVDHDDKSYVVIDEEAIRNIAGQVSEAMKQVEEALKNVPEGQREAVEKMLKERMPNQQPSRISSELRKTSERATQNGYPCVKYEVWREGRKIRELWVTDWNNVEGGDEAVVAFGDMAEFFKEMLEAFSNSGLGAMGGMDDTMFEHMKEMDGFPVVTRDFDDDGSLEGESTLQSARRQTLDPASFEPPAGYKRRSMGPR